MPNIDNTDHEKLDIDSQINRFRHGGRLCIDLICNYFKNIEKFRVFPDVQPGYLRRLLPKHPPQKPERIEDILDDFKKHILLGTVHWNHPMFYAYFPASSGYANVLADMISSKVGGSGFSWQSQPSLTELETKMMDWYGRALDLPPFFIFEDSNGLGGGMTYGSASEAIFSTIIAARNSQFKKHGCYSSDPGHPHEGNILAKLVCYTSTESHSCVEKAAKIALCTVRLLTPNNTDSVTGEILEKAIREDLEKGLIPFYISAICGSTNSCSCDELSTIGPVCKKYNMWMHVDGAYAGNSFICPEYRHLKIGIEYADSFDTNPYKFLMGAVDCSCVWARNMKLFKEPWVVGFNRIAIDNEKSASDRDEYILKHEINYRDCGMTVSRRMRALKLWFLFRSFGVSGLQEHIRKLCKMATYFGQLVKQDSRFELTSDIKLSLVCFRQKENPEFAALNDENMNYTDKQNINLLLRINKSRKLHLCPAHLKGQYVLRYSVTYEHITEEIVAKAWKLIQSFYVNKLDELPEMMLNEASRLSYTQAVPENVFNAYKKSSLLLKNADVLPIPVPADAALSSLMRLPALRISSAMGRHSALSLTPIHEPKK